MTLIRIFKITNPKHPHYGESGTYLGEAIVATKQLIIHLRDCVHGTEQCAISKEDIA